MTDEPVTVRFVADAGTRKMLTREGDYAEGYAAGFEAAKKAAESLAKDAAVAWGASATEAEERGETINGASLLVDELVELAEAIAALKPEDRE